MRTTLLATLLLAATAAAQTPPCFGVNDATTSVSTGVTTYGFAGQNTLAWQITPAVPLVVHAAKIFTRNSNLTGDRFMTLELWDDVGGLPGTRLGGGSWRIVNARPNDWQGADLDQVVVLLPNVPAWVVWIEPGFSIVPQETGGTTMPRAYRSGTGPWTTTTVGAGKLRLYCGLLDEAWSSPYGQRCPQSSGLYSSVFTNEVPNVGNAGFFFETSGNPSGGAVFVVFGMLPFPSAPIPGFPTGCMQNTDVIASIFLVAGTGTTRGPTCAGYLSVPMGIPNDPSLGLVTIAAQAVPYDPGAAAPLPFATSNAQRITIF